MYVIFEKRKALSVTITEVYLYKLVSEKGYRE